MPTLPFTQKLPFQNQHFPYLNLQSWCIKRRIKVKCILVQALRRCTGRTAHRGSRGIALHFLDHGTRRGRGVSVKARPLFTPGKDRVPIVQEAGWAPGPFWTGTENLAPTGIPSPDLPARSESLYRLSYPGPRCEANILCSEFTACVKIAILWVVTTCSFTK